MRLGLVSGFILIMWSWPITVNAQPPQPMLYGWGDKIVHLCDLPGDVRAELRNETNHDLAVGYFYQHWFLFGEGFDIWTWDGKVVLFQGLKYWQPTEEQLIQMIGKERFAELGPPFTYYCPVGLLVLGILGIVLGVVGYYSATARAKRMLKDQRYQQALQVYAQAMPAETEPTSAEKKTALAAAVAFAQQEHNIEPAVAEKQLRLLISELDRDTSYMFRTQAVQHEQAEEWEEAIEYYEKAARLREGWDDKDYQFLLKCVQRVRDKQARSQQD